MPFSWPAARLPVFHRASGTVTLAPNVELAKIDENHCYAPWPIPSVQMYEIDHSNLKDGMTTKADLTQIENIKSTVKSIKETSAMSEHKEEVSQVVKSMVYSENPTTQQNQSFRRESQAQIIQPPLPLAQLQTVAKKKKKCFCC